MLSKKIVYYLVLSMLLLTSCKAFKNFTSSSYNNPANYHPKTSDSAKAKNVRFLNDIEVTPGSAVKSQHTINKDRYQQHPAAVAAVNRINPPLTKAADLENTDKLQLKYAVLLNVNVEDLTNIALLQKMDEWWGTLYCYGGTTKNCTDCSAFSQNMLQDVYNIKIPRTAQDQYNACTKIDESELHEGDLVFFHGTAGRRGPYISHVGIYLSNGKFVHASSGGGGVTVNSLNDNYYRKHFVSGGRFVQQTATANTNRQ